MVAVKVWVFMAVSACACVEHRPMPLYPRGSNPASHELATLYGDVRDVDGSFVSAHGGSFELLAGCHVVGVVETWGNMSDTGGVVARIPRTVFALPMRAKHRYVVKIDAIVRGGPTGRLTIQAREEDADGNVTRTFEPAGSDELAACAGEAM